MVAQHCHRVYNQKENLKQKFKDQFSFFFSVAIVR